MYIVLCSMYEWHILAAITSCPLSMCKISIKCRVQTLDSELLSGHVKQTNKQMQVILGLRCCRQWFAGYDMIFGVVLFPVKFNHGCWEGNSKRICQKTLWSGEKVERFTVVMIVDEMFLVTGNTFLASPEWSMSFKWAMSMGQTERVGLLVSHYFASL